MSDVHEKTDNGNTTHLAGHSSLEKNSRGVIQELELFQHLDSLLIVGDELQVLIRDRKLELGDVTMENLEIMNHGKLCVKPESVPDISSKKSRTTYMTAKIRAAQAGELRKLRCEIVSFS